MPINFGLNTWQDASINTSSTSDGSTISSTEGCGLKDQRNMHEYNEELTHILDCMAEFTNHFSGEIAHVERERDIGSTQKLYESNSPGMATNTFQEVATIE
jgi:hypothetical protein